MAERLEQLEAKRAPNDPIGLIDHKLNSNWLRTYRAKLEKQWLKCVAYARGIQAETWADMWSTGGMDENLRSPGASSRGRFTINKIKPFLARRRAQLVSAPPGWECQPNSPDYTDRTAAEMAMDVLNHLYYDRHFYERNSEAAWWTAVCGVSYIRPAWGATMGPVQEIFFDPTDPDGGVLPEEMLTPQVKDALRNLRLTEMVPTGDLDLKVFSPFTLIEAPASKNDYRPWAIELEMIHIEEAYDRYPEYKVDRAQRGTNSSKNQVWMTNLARVEGMLGPLAGRVSAYDDEETILIRTLFIRPCRRYPKGRYVVEGGGIPFVDGPSPYLDFGIMDPHIAFPYSVEGGGHYPGGLVEDLVKAQKALNDVRDARVENTRLMGNPKWLVERKSGVDKITNRHGGVIKYNGLPPQPVKIDPIDQAGEQINQTLIQDMQDLGFQQDVTQAKVPPNLRSGVAISLLQERDDAGVTPVVRVWDRRQAQLGDYCLRIVCQMYPTGKVLRVYGKDRQWDIREFKTGVIDGRVSVVTPEERRTPKSRTMEMQKIFEGAETGIIDMANPLARIEAMRSMDLSGAWEKVYQLQTAHSRRARQENEIFAELGPQGPDGQYPAVEPWEDHAVHRAVHDELRVSDRWEAMPSEVRLVLDAHCAQHDQHLAEEQKRQFEMMELARGAPGQKGRASQPAK